MSIRYLARTRTLDDFEQSPIAQLVNVPELERCQRCIFCHYFVNNRTNDDYDICAASHKCDGESLIFLPMVNSDINDSVRNEHFTPTQLIRSLRISQQPRYLQLWSCDLTGYVCNSKCHYYPSRIESGVTVNDCATSHACGMNGSFLDLLEPFTKLLYTIPDFAHMEVPTGDTLLSDGTILEQETVSDFYMDSDLILYAIFGSGDRYPILNMMPDTVNAGKYLKGYNDTTLRYLEWVEPYYNHLDIGPFVVIRDLSDHVADTLVQYGYEARLFIDPLPDLTRITLNSGNTYYFVNWSDKYRLIHIGTRYLVQIQPYDSSTWYFIEFGSGTNVCLGAPVNTKTTSRWRKYTFEPAELTPYTRLTILSYNASMAQWLRQIGVRDSLFYGL